MKLLAAVDAYIRHRRESGVKFATPGKDLLAFGKFLGNVEIASITAEDNLAFLNRNPVSTYTWRRRYRLIAKFFRWWFLVGEIPRVNMPAPRGHVRQSFTPHLYTRAEIHVLLTATGEFRRNTAWAIHAETYRALILFIYGCGARTKEATTLRMRDIDLATQEITFQATEFRGRRTIPLGRDMRRFLRRHLVWRQSVGIQGDFLFPRKDGKPLDAFSIHRGFRKLLTVTQIKRKEHSGDRPRLCDFRNTFAVHQITSWIRRKEDLNRLLPALSAYLGQRDLSATEIFLAQTPARFKKDLNKLSPQQGPRWSDNADVMRFISNL